MSLLFDLAAGAFFFSEVHPACSPDLSWELANNPGGELLIVHHGTGGSPPAGVCSLLLSLR